jgi:hypothetical protein
VARRLLDAEEIAHYEQVLTPLVASPTVEVLRIYPEIVTGHRLTAASPA